jgi:predicted RNA methylase
MQLTKIIKKIQLLHSTSTETPTDFELAREMVRLLPVEWKNPNLKILDPACGRGTFLLAAMERLESEGHSRKHIITNMLWGVDINPVQCMIACKALSLAKNVKSNIICDNVLTRNFDMKFDVVVGNPPYQKENSTAKRWTLWEEFVKFSKTIADTVVMVTPQSITSPGTFDLIKDNATIINIDVSKHFNVGSTFCYWVIDTTKPSTGTKIITDNGEYHLDLSDINFLPSVVTKETLTLINSLNSRTPRTWKRGELHTSNTNLFDANGKYTVMHTNAQTLKSNTEHANKTKIRVAVTLSGYPTFRVITNGYVSQACFWTECNTLDEAQALADECNGEEVQKMLSIFKWSGWNSKEVIQCL